ncbi:glia maturation factor gamma [Labeo rohita]|uniref:Glia maturation factor gamma n=1 Tax=Labeo rohita TaxID=84645 RepID=A0A498LAS0_LABRO|nr:glia maturation factor gamma [Labeo rohita]
MVLERGGRQPGTGQRSASGVRGRGRMQTQTCLEHLHAHTDAGSCGRSTRALNKAHKHSFIPLSVSDYNRAAHNQIPTVLQTTATLSADYIHHRHTLLTSTAPEPQTQQGQDSHTRQKAVFNLTSAGASRIFSILSEEPRGTGRSEPQDGKIISSVSVRSDCTNNMSESQSSSSLVVCEVDVGLQEKLKKFRFRKETNNAAILMKIDMEKQLVVLEEEYENISMDELREELPERQPRYPHPTTPTALLIHALSRFHY